LLFSSPGIRGTLSGKGFALALQLRQTLTDSGKIVGGADRHRFLPRLSSLRIAAQGIYDELFGAVMTALSPLASRPRSAC
jgi:hypothetical protein